PAANFTVNVTSGEAPLAVAFTDTSTGNPSAWSWDFGDGDTSDEQHPVHVYTEAGTYTVTLTVTNAVGSDTETDLIAVADGGTGFVRGPYLTGTTTNLTVVSWKSDENCTGTVEFADDAFYTANSAYDRSVDAATTTDFQHVTIENLAPDTLYHYRIAAGDATTADHTFRTFPEHGGFTFIVYGDTQLPANIELVADRITDEHPLFVLHTGDLVNDIESEDELDNFFESSRQMLANTTLYTTLGNHEYYTTTSPSPTTGNSIYHNITGMPEWYSFNCSNAHFAILDDNNDYADITQESAWLEQDLSTDAIWKFVANHHPPYSSVSGRAGGWLYPRQWWGQTMQDAGVSAVFNGHVHAYERYIVDGITYLVTGTGAGSLCSLGGDIPDGYQTSLTHTLGYTKITVYPNGTAAGQFVEVARLDPDNSSKVLEVYPPGTVFETYTITSPLQGADLAAVSLDIPAGVTAGTACTVNGTVDNLGDAISAPFSVTLSIGASLVDTAAVDPLAPNETTVVSFSWTPSAPGATNVTMAIDPAMTVQDTDRTNNNLTVAVTVADSGSGSDTAPVAGFTANVTSGEAPLAVAFTDTSSGAPSAWSWTFGDGATSNEQHPVHIYTAAGTYTVGLTAANAAGSNSTVQSGYIVVTSIEPANETITLYPGWNFVSTPKTLADGHDTIAIFGNVDTAAHSVLLYNGLRGWKAMSSQDTFRPLDGIWIYANGSYAIPLVFAPGSPQTPPEKTLDPGWNAIGFTGTVPETAADALRSVEDRWVTLIGFDAEQQVYGVSIIRGAGGRHDETREMSPMQGYWLYMNDVGTLDAIDA
ncbi:MAG: hypothetical protein PWP08_546, partial [Methanofollis sp.]|nr:hypothetical protein [Methanofollis sp.]